MHRLWHQGAPGSRERAEGRKAVRLMLGATLVLSGAGGLPFTEDLEDLIDGIAQMAGYNLSSKRAQREFLESVFGADVAGVISRGFTGLPGAPIDVSARLGLGNLIPGTGLVVQGHSHTGDVLDLLGPVGDLGRRALYAARDVASGNIGSGVMEIAPLAVRNAVRGLDMAATGMYHDRRGYKVLDTNLLEAAAKSIGFQPASVAKIQQANWINQKAKGFYNQRAAEIRALWAQGIFEQDQGKVQAAREAITDWNARNPGQPMVIRIPDIMRRVRQMALSKDQRIAATAPKAMRAHAPGAKRAARHAWALIRSWLSSRLTNPSRPSLDLSDLWMVRVPLSSTIFSAPPLAQQAPGATRQNSV